MFNCYSKNGEIINFRSNPPLEDKPVVEPEIIDGVITNHISYKAVDNHSKLESVVYDEKSMSLRAKLNLGVRFSEVANPQLDDFAQAYSKLESLETQIIQKMNEEVSKKTQKVESSAPAAE